MNEYPSEKYLKGKTVEDLKEEMIVISHNQCSTKRCQKILETIENDKTEEKEYQDSRDVITRGIVKDLAHYYNQQKDNDNINSRYGNKLIKIFNKYVEINKNMANS